MTNASVRSDVFSSTLARQRFPRKDIVPDPYPTGRHPPRFNLGLHLYKPLLILKYLTKRRIAWVSLIAVALCTALVITVISVMGGWLQNFKDSFKGLSGDVVVTGMSPTVGFPHYQEMIDRLQAMPQVRAAVPVLRAYGLANLDNQIRAAVQVVGVPIDRIGQVNEFTQSLYLQSPDHKGGLHADADAATVEDVRERYASGQLQPPSFELPLPEKRYRSSLPASRMDVMKMPGMIVGTGVVGTTPSARGVGAIGFWARLTTLAIDPSNPGIDEQGDKAERLYWIIDDSHTGNSTEDNNNVYVPFDLLQVDLKMNERPYTDAYTGQAMVNPARTNELHVDGQAGVTLVQLRDLVKQVVDEVNAEHDVGRGFATRVQTWEEVHGQIIGAVEHEKALVTFLMGLISIVAVFLIFCIFYMIVVEKTRDIGILKSVGASGGGIAAIFIGYGGVIGIVGGLLGVALGASIVWNINVIHDWMGKLLNIQIWDSDLYLFDKIPNKLDPFEVSVVVAVAILSSVLGACIPAYIAARLKPVEALRFE